MPTQIIAASGKTRRSAGTGPGGRRLLHAAGASRGRIAPPHRDTARGQAVPPRSDSRRKRPARGRRTTGGRGNSGSCHPFQHRSEETVGMVAMRQQAQRSPSSPMPCRPRIAARGSSAKSGWAARKASTTSFVLFRQQAAGGVHQPAARLDQARRRGQDRRPAWRSARRSLSALAPLQIRDCGAGCRGRNRAHRPARGRSCRPGA